jgi:hypothetical protein
LIILALFQKREHSSERESGLTFLNQPKGSFTGLLGKGGGNTSFRDGNIQTTGNAGLGPRKELSFLFNARCTVESC